MKQRAGRLLLQLREAINMVAKTEVEWKVVSSPATSVSNFCNGSIPDLGYEEMTVHTSSTGIYFFHANLLNTTYMNNS